MGRAEGNLGYIGGFLCHVGLDVGSDPAEILNSWSVAGAGSETGWLVFKK